MPYPGIPIHGKMGIPIGPILPCKRGSRGSQRIPFSREGPILPVEWEPGSAFTRKIGIPIPILPVKWGWGSPIWGTHFPMTPALLLYMHVYSLTLHGLPHRTGQCTPRGSDALRPFHQKAAELLSTLHASS